MSRNRPVELTNEQVRLLERFSPEFRERHIEAALRRRRPIEVTS